MVYAHLKDLEKEVIGGNHLTVLQACCYWPWYNHRVALTLKHCLLVAKSMDNFDPAGFALYFFPRNCHSQGGSEISGGSRSVRVKNELTYRNRRI